MAEPSSRASGGRCAHRSASPAIADAVDGPSEPEGVCGAPGATAESGALPTSLSGAGPFDATPTERPTWWQALGGGDPAP